MAPSPLRAPLTRANHAVPPGAAARRDPLRPGRRRCRRRSAAVHQGRVRRVPRMRHPGPLLPAPALRRLRCGNCGRDKLVAFSCKRGGICPSCGAQRMAQTAVHLVDHVIPLAPVRQWVLSLPIPLRLLPAAQPKLVTPALPVVHRVITRRRPTGRTPAFIASSANASSRPLGQVSVPRKSTPVNEALGFAVPTPTCQATPVPAPAPAPQRPCGQNRPDLHAHCTCPDPPAIHLR